MKRRNFFAMLLVPVVMAKAKLFPERLHYWRYSFFGYAYEQGVISDSWGIWYPMTSDYARQHWVSKGIEHCAMDEWKGYGDGQPRLIDPEGRLRGKPALLLAEEEVRDSSDRSLSQKSIRIWANGDMSVIKGPLNWLW